MSFFTNRFSRICIVESNLIPIIFYSKKEQPFQYYLCFDVEATCEKGGGFEYKNEIIEFPIILLEGKTFEIVINFSLTFIE